MKIKTTRKNINNNYRKVFCTGYCDLQYIMRNFDATYYNSGVYGWNYDVYIDAATDIAITTGYRGMFGVRIPSEILEKYTTAAKKILQNLPFGEWQEEIDKNRVAFFKELNNL